MSNHQRNSSDKPGGRQGAGDAGAGPPAGKAATSGHERDTAPRDAMKRERLDTIEMADDLSEEMNPHRGGSEEDTDSVGEMLEGHESNAHYRREARRVTPTIGPDEDRDTR